VARSASQLGGVGQAVRVSPASYGALKQLAAEAGLPIARCLDELVQEAYERRIWARYAEANRRTESDPQARAVREADDAVWAAADADGLDPDEGVEWNEALEDAASW
jgi:hypothetical protein